MQINNDILQTINEFIPEVDFFYNKHGDITIYQKCECCQKKIRYTKNTLQPVLTIPKCIELKKNRLNSFGKYYSYVYENSTSKDIFGKITIDDRDYDYKQYVMENYTQMIDNRQRNFKKYYKEDWETLPNNVKVYADIEIGDKFFKNIMHLDCTCCTIRKNNKKRKIIEHFQELWETNTEIPFEEINNKKMLCYKCRDTHWIELPF